MDQSNRSNMVKANQLQSDISKLEKELNDLQDECDHSEKVIKQIPGSGNGGVKKYCKFCNKELSYPTAQELENYLYGNKGNARKD